jgi:RNA polymerase sigma factor (sigma-70 family)
MSSASPPSAWPTRNRIAGRVALRKDPLHTPLLQPPYAMDLPAGTAESDALLLAALPVLEDVLNYVGRRHRCSVEEREEFGSVARLKLLENDRAILRQFRGLSTLRGYLSIVVQRQFTDFRRQRWGTWRPSAEARRLGPAAKELERLIQCDGYSLEQAIEVMRSAGRSTLTAEALQAMALQLPQRTRRRMVPEDAAAGVGVSAEQAVEGPALVHSRRNRAQELRAALGEVMKDLPAGDALVLRLRYVDGFTVRRIATVFDEPQRPFYRRLERLLTALQRALGARGFAQAEVEELLGDPAFDDTPGGAWPAKKEPA